MPPEPNRLTWSAFGRSADILSHFLLLGPFTPDQRLSFLELTYSCEENVIITFAPVFSNSNELSLAASQAGQPLITRSEIKAGPTNAMNAWALAKTLPTVRTYSGVRFTAVLPYILLNWKQTSTSTTDLLISALLE